MKVTRFDRHENMSSDTLSDVMDIISEVKWNGHELVNNLYGLFDGYLYSNTLNLATKEKVSSTTYLKIKSVLEVVKTYPTI